MSIISYSLPSISIFTKLLFSSFILEKIFSIFTLFFCSILQTTFSLNSLTFGWFIKCLKFKSLNQSNNWKSCESLYFKTKIRVLDKPIIGLIADDNALINNIFFHNTFEIEILHLTRKKKLFNNKFVKKIAP